MLQESFEGMRENMRAINEEHAHSISTLRTSVQEIRPKKGPPGISRAPVFSGEGEDANSFLEKFMELSTSGLTKNIVKLSLYR